VLETQLPPTVLYVSLLGSKGQVADVQSRDFLDCIPHRDGRFCNQGFRVSLVALRRLLMAISFAPKGYVICLLAVLNSRQSLRRDMSSENSFMVSFSSYERDRYHMLKGRKTCQRGIEIR
jgi:hypothetical protein